MKESGYYPAGSYRDPSAPWNEIYREEEVRTTISMEWSKTVDIHDIPSCYDEVLQFLADCSEVATLPKLNVSYDDGSLTLWVEDMDITITATAIGNSINNKNPQITEDDIHDAVQAQWRDLFAIEGYEIDQL